MNKLLSNLFAGVGVAVVAKKLADSFTVVRKYDEDETVKALAEMNFETLIDARHVLDEAKDILNDYDWVSVADILTIADDMGYTKFPAFIYSSDRGWPNLDDAFVYSAYHYGNKVYRIHYPKSHSVKN